MADATKLPSVSDSQYFYWASCELTRPLTASTTDTTAYWSEQPLDEDGTLITGNFLIGATNRDGKTELMWVASGQVAADGLSATVVRGIDIAGPDYTAGSSDHVYAIESGQPVFCAITPNIQNLVIQAIQGAIASGGNQFRIGDQTAGTKTYGIDVAGSFVGIIRSDGSTTEISNDGTTWVSLSDALAGNLIKITSADTTAGYLDDKLVSSSSRVTFTVVNPGGNEDISIDLAMNATDAEIDQALSGIGATVTQANLDTLTDGSNADALHTHTAPAISATTAEAVDGSSTPQALAIMGDNYKDLLIISPSGSDLFNVTSGSYNNFGDADTSTRRAQSFSVTDALASTISLESLFVVLEKAASPTDDLTIEIQTDSSGEPSGTVVTNGTSDTVTGSGVDTASDIIEFTWSTPPSLTSGATYWAVIKRSGANNGTNYYKILDANGNVYTGNSAVYTASTMTWSTSTTDLQMLFRFKKDYDGDVAKLDNNDLTRCNFIGFTESNVAGGATATITQDAFQGGFSGLTTGAMYYADTTAGGVTLNPTFSTTFGSAAPMIQLGRALKADTLEIRPEFTFALDELTFTLVETGAASQTNDLNVPIICGFPPKEVWIKYQRLNVGGTATEDRFVVKRFIGTTELPEFYIDPISFGSVGSISGAADAGIIVSEVYDNGVLLRLRETHEDEAISDVQIIIRG